MAATVIIETCIHSDIQRTVSAARLCKCVNTTNTVTIQSQFFIMSTDYTFQWEWEKQKEYTAIHFSAKVKLMGPTDELERTLKRRKLEDSANAPSIEVLKMFKVNVETICTLYGNLGHVQIPKDQELEWSDLLEKMFNKISNNDIINVDDLPTLKDLPQLFDYQSHIRNIRRGVRVPRGCRVPMFEQFYKAFKACVNDDFSNGAGKSFGMMLLDLLVGTYLCPMAKTFQQQESKAGYGLKSKSSSATDERKKSGDSQSASSESSQQQTTKSTNRNKRMMGENYNLNVRYADVVLQAHDKVLSENQQHIFLLKSVVEIKSKCTCSSVKEAIQQGINYGLCASKETGNQRVLLCLLTPQDWLLGWLSPIEANVELVSIGVIGKNPRTKQRYFSKEGFLRFVRLLESYGRNEFVEDCCQSCENE